MPSFSIWLDLDDVIYPLSEVVIEQYNKDYNDKFDWRDNTQYWWQDTKAPIEYFQELLKQPNIFYDGEPTQTTFKYVNKMLDDGYEVNIISSPQLTGYCYEEKLKWIHLWFPRIKIDNIYFCWDKSKLAKPNRILYDDNLKHLQDFSLSKGIAISKPFGWNKEWEGLVANNMKEFYYLVKVMECIQGGY